MGFRDISERQRASEVRQKQIEQEQLVAQLEQVNQLKDDFLNTVSHELRTPLSNIMMAIQILQSTGTDELGTRKPSEYGIRWTRQISIALAKNGFTVVSGLAEGIETD